MTERNKTKLFLPVTFLLKPTRKKEENITKAINSQKDCDLVGDFFEKNMAALPDIRRFQCRCGLHV